jgi:hypothetical protein
MKHEIRKDGELVATIETHGDSVIVVHEPVNPDYSHLVGKWVQYYLEGYEQESFFSKWVKIESVRTTKAGLQLTLHENPYLNDYEEYHESCFDLSNPRDTNPDEEERVIPFALERWRSRDYVSVQTRDGQEVMDLTEFASIELLAGVIKGNRFTTNWLINGRIDLFFDKPIDLMLVIKGGKQ